MIALHVGRIFFVVCVYVCVCVWGGGPDFSPEEADCCFGAMQIPQWEMFSLADKTTD